MSLLDLLSSKPVLFDGAMGTELQNRGLAVGSPPDLWNIEKPEVVRQVHLDYIRAGSQVVETNTFGGTQSRLERSGAVEFVDSVNSTGAKIALEAAGKTAAVVGSVGPLGSLIEPYGDISKEDAAGMFRKQVETLRAYGVQTILIETMISLDEALVALEGAKSAGASEVGVTMTFQRSGDEVRTAFGESAADCVRRLEKAGASFVGSNCGSGFEDMMLVATEIRRSTRLPVLIQPNAGVPTVENNVVQYSGSPKGFAEFVRSVSKIGIEMIGGCCGTTPAHIEEARKVVDSL
ncbi:MAG: homocysteine S-methyltransferase family protein [Bacteroidetes bacterium]|jgi:5-methyltetrahydrofolate--homocysteine methyltransferase|nr:homocysteine S-methyltransferase family protein [Bacteroidota bacterium]MCL5034059.1 homocysteine S-methyltransferase family protein [Bacteroidota bacterium]